MRGLYLKITTPITEGEVYIPMLYYQTLYYCISIEFIVNVEFPY